MTLIELMIVMAIVSILAAAVFPLSRMTMTRAKELELRRDLRVVRAAIDKYKDLYDQGRIGQKVGGNGYPSSMEVLVEGFPSDSEPGKKIRLLRRIPKDPMTERGEWGMRSHNDSPESTTWGGEDIFDVYSKSDETALDGTKYSEW